MSDPHPERYLYLRDLLAELEESPQLVARQQVLANIANFAYDPRNAAHLLRLDAPRLLLARLADPDEALRRFAAAAVCNLCLDPPCRRGLLSGGLLPALLLGLEDGCVQTAASCLTTLLLLPVTERSVWQQVDGGRLARLTVQLSRAEDRRLANLATLLLRKLPASVAAEDRQQDGAVQGQEAPDTRGKLSST